MTQDAAPAGESELQRAEIAAAPAVAQRAGDADRERTVVLLRDATSEGRLTLEEFSERVEKALHARTHDELQALGADLVGVSLPAVQAEPPASRWVVAAALNRKGRWPLPPNYRLSVVCGTVALDLGQAVVQAAVTTLHVRNYFGTVTILVPEAVQVEIDDGGAFLTNDVALPDRQPPESAPLIRLRLTGMGGTNRVRAASAPLLPQ